MIRKIFDRLFFLGPMSLGDTFVLNGMVHYWGDRCNELHVPCLPKFYETTRSLYQDYPQIIVAPVEPFDGGENQYVKEHQLCRILRKDLLYSNIKGFNLIPMWDLQLYANYDIPFDLRYSNFRAPKHVFGSMDLYKRLSGGERYALVHRFSNDFPTGAPINIPSFRASAGLPDIKIIEITEGIATDMMQFVDLIKYADEIHCIPSSFHCLVDSLTTTGQLFFHDIREKTSMTINSEWNDFKWQMVYYSQRL